MIYSGKASSNMSLCNSYNPFRKILKLFKNEKQKHNKESSQWSCAISLIKSTDSKTL